MVSEVRSVQSEASCGDFVDADPAGTSFLIEDVACPVNRLADMTVDLGNMFQKHGYDDASCFGHALEGNLHLVFSQVRRLTRRSQGHMPLACGRSG